MDLRSICFTYCPQDQPYEMFRLAGWGEVRIYMLEEDIFRVLFLPQGRLTLDRSWMICPQQDLPWEGRDRLDVSGFSRPEYHVETSQEMTIIETSKLRVAVAHHGFRLQWYARRDGEWQIFARDRQTQSYNFGQWGTGIFHYLQRERSEQYFGLGEKSGNMDRAGRRFRMFNMDALGYDAESSDPLYKHIPFYITRDRQKQIAFGLFYDNLATAEFDLGQELDNYHGLYRYYQAQAGDLDYYLILGPGIKDVTQRFAWLTGPTLFGPKWSLGYSGSTMSYTDAPNAQELLQYFLEDCRRYEIPCDSFQLSSGYTSIGAKRYVFNWNTEKIPDPKTLVEQFHAVGIKLCANIKPCLLTDHPRFQEGETQQLFIRRQDTESPYIAQFWGAVGAYLDFTNPDAIAWWQQQVRQQLLEYGIDSTWNDNNEFEIWDDAVQCHGFGPGIPIGLIRPVLALLMMKASFEVQQAHLPEKRPYLISRSGCPGMQRYVQTWSGDNFTSWKTLKYNIRMGKGLSLCGIFNFGHDVGGFAGSAPEPELLVRWVQNGIFHPRFTIHSWNDDGTVNEPWMYPEVLPFIREQIRFRYRLLPYLYTRLYRASTYNEPIIRPTFYDYEDDERTFEENDDFLLGSALLVASVVESGQRERSVYLPKGPAGWYDFHSEQWHESGQTITVDAPLDRCPLFVKEGGIIPLIDPGRNTQQIPKSLELRCYPYSGVGESRCEIFDDDGESWAYQTGRYALLQIRMRSDEQQIFLHVNKSGDAPLPYHQLIFCFPAAEQRPVTVKGDGYLQSHIVPPENPL